MKNIFYTIILITISLQSSYAGKCKVKLKVHNEEDVKIKILGFKYKCGGSSWKDEKILTTPIVDMGDKWTSINQKLSNCLDYQIITHVKARYKKYQKHQSSKKWSDKKYTKSVTFEESCRDGLGIPPGQFLKAK